MQRRTLVWIVVAVAVPVLLVGAALWSLRLSSVQQWITAGVRDTLAAEGVTAGEIGGDWPEEIVLTDLAIRDAEGVWLRIAELRGTIALWPLASRTVVFETLDVNGAHMLRRPLPAEDTEPDDERGGPWPELPVDLRAEALSVTARLDASVLGEAATLRLQGSGAFRRDGATADLTLERTDGVAGRITLDARTTARLDDWALSLHAADAGLVAAAAGESRLRDLTAALDLAYGGEELSGSGRITAPALATLTLDSDAEGALRLAVPEVATLAAEAGLALQGPLRAQVAGLVLDLEGASSARVALDLTGLASTDAAIARLIAGGSAEALLRWSSDAGAAAENLSVTLADGALTLAGQASRDAGGALDGRLGVAAVIGALTDAAAGALAAEVALGGTAAAPALSAEATITDAAAGTLAWPRVEITGRWSDAGGGAGRIVVEGEVPVVLDAAVMPEGEGQRITANGTVLGAAVEANLLAASEAITGEAAVDAPDLAPFGRLAGIPLAGRAEAEASLGEDTARVRITATDVAAESLVLDRVALTAEGPRDALALSAEARGSVNGEPLEAAATATAGLDGGSGTLRTLTASLGARGVRLAAPAAVVFGEAPMLENAALTLAQAGRRAGTMTLTASLAGGVALTAEAQGIDVNALAGGRTGGTAEATLRFDGAAGTGSLALTIDGLRTSRRVPPLDVRAEADWAGGRLTAEARATGRGLSPAEARFAMALPRDPDGGIPDVPEGAPIAGSLRWQGEAANAVRLLDLADHEIAGAIDVDLVLGGTLEAPEITGDATLARGRYTNGVLGTRLEDLTLALEGNAGRLNARLSATDGGAGRVTGDAVIVPAEGLGGITGTVTLSEARLIRRDDLDATIDGSVRIVPGTPEEGPLLSGTLTAAPVRASIPEGLPGDVVVVDVIDPEAPPRERPLVPEEPPAAALPLRLAITLAIPGPMRVSGRGLDSLWAGALEIGGTIAEPRITGEIRLDRGTLDFAGRTLTLARGSIEFDGGSRIDPRIDIAADAESDGIEAEIAVTGRPSSLRLTARSTPPLPEEEVLARVLFGKPVSRLSTVEALQLARAVASISGGGGDFGGGLLADIRDALGVDVLRIEGLGESGGPSVTAGAYLAQGVYVGVRQRGGQTGAVAEVEITDELTLESDLGPEAGSTIGLNYEKRY